MSQSWSYPPKSNTIMCSRFCDLHENVQDRMFKKPPKWATFLLCSYYRGLVRACQEYRM
jgi:hypothetical protein